MDPTKKNRGEIRCWLFNANNKCALYIQAKIIWTIH